MRDRRCPASAIRRAMLLVAVLAALGLSAGAAVPSATSADDNGDNGDSHQCTGGFKTADDPTTPAFEQTCTITASSGTCIQRSSRPVVVQRCLVSQGPTTLPPTGTTPRNISLTVIQTADQHGAEGVLDATQIVDGPPLPLTPANRGEQRNFGTANTTADITQVIEQKLASGIDDDDDGLDDDDNGQADEDGDGEPDDDNGEVNGPPDLEIHQFTQAHQWVDLCQGGIPCDTPPPATTMAGRNKATVFQSETSHMLAANAALIVQNENAGSRKNECSAGPGPEPDDTFARECYMIRQNTKHNASSIRNPANRSQLRQFSDELEIARNTLAGHQGQGFSSTNGGLDHSFVQTSPGIALLISDQDEYQTQRRTNTGAMTQGQLGFIRKGSGIQGTNPNSLTNLRRLEKTQYTGGPPTGQTGGAKAFAVTSGECIAHLEVTENGVTKTANEPGGDKTPAGDVCNEFVSCMNVYGTPSCVSSDDISFFALKRQ